MLFRDFELSAGVIQRMQDRGILEPSPIQAESLPHTLKGRDLVGRARTGTGKTLAYALPILERLEPQSRRGRLPRALVLAPTRELAKQVAGEFAATGPQLRVVTVYGGAPYGPQERALSDGIDVVVGTPGRIIDHLERGNLQLQEVQVAVLDEADEMLQVGFAEDVERILGATTNPQRQTLFFSATLTLEVLRLAQRYLKEPVLVDLVGEERGKTSQTVQHVAIRVGRSRTHLLADLLTVHDPERAIVFTRTKKEADELAMELIHRGLEAEGLHGDMAQSQRERAMASFRSGRTRVLVATDVAARGLDIPEVDLVVQYHLPSDSDAYIHRTGRTGRAGRSGTAIVLYGDREGRALHQLEYATGVTFERREPPRPQDVQQAAVHSASQLVCEVDPALGAPFLEEAEALLREHGSEILARALAKVAGISELPKPSSLLSGEESMTALLMVGERLSVPRVVALLARRLDDARRLGKIRLCAEGAVVDVPNELVPGLLALSPLEGNIRLEVPTQLPELLESSDGRPPRERDGQGMPRRSRPGGRYQSRGEGYFERPRR